MKKIVSLISTAYGWLNCGASLLQSPLLLIMRLYWGWSFFQSGSGKLFKNFDRTVGFFTELGLPLPKIQVLMAGSTECFGGLLLALGLGSRLVSIPLAFTMVVAYVTADRESLNAIFSDTDKFTGAAPFLFLLTALIVLAFGPGAFSLDWLISKKCCCKKADA